MFTIIHKCRQYNKGSKMSEDKVGYAEGIDRTEARLRMIDAILVIVEKKVVELERRVKELEDWR